MATQTQIKTLSFQIQQSLGISAKGKLPTHQQANCYDFYTNTIVNGWHSVDYIPSGDRLKVDQAAYGMRHALITGRIYGQLANAIERNLSARELCLLLAEIALSCPCSGDVSQWLLANQNRFLTAA